MCQVDCRRDAKLCHSVGCRGLWFRTTLRRGWGVSFQEPATPLQPRQSRLEDFVSNAFPLPVCTPHLISPGEGSKSASRWRAGLRPAQGPIPPHLGDLSKSHHIRKLAPRRPRIPFAVWWSSQRPVAEQGKVESCTPGLVPLFGSRRLGARGGLEDGRWHRLDSGNGPLGACRFEFALHLRGPGLWRHWRG